MRGQVSEPQTVQQSPAHPGLSTSEHQSPTWNQDIDQDHHCQTLPQEPVIHENQSLTPGSMPGSSVDQEHFTGMFMMKETKSEGIPQREDPLLHSCETQILLPISDPPIDTREYIPACFAPVATLSQCTHEGRYYHNDHNDFSLEIPAGAIPVGESIIIDIGVALYGPFQYPEGLRPVSPVFWVCVRDQNHFQFFKPVKVTIPHCLNLENHNDIESLGPTFLKGDHEMNLQRMYQLQQAEGDILIEPLKKYSVLETTHFCSLCISCQVTNEFTKKALFCISAVFPPTISAEDSAYFFITFFLKTCLNVVEDQISKDTAIQRHKRGTQHFQFSSDGEEQALEIVLPQPLPGKWKIGLRFMNKVSFVTFSIMQV